MYNDNQKLAQKRYGQSTKGKAKKAAWRRTPAGKACEAARKRSHAGKQQVAEDGAKYRAAHPDRVAAHNAVTNALARGELVRKPCFMCGATGHAHHPSYAEDMRLAVTWLCRAHHDQLHAEFRRQ